MLVAFTLAFVLTTAGLTWLFGPYGLIGSGLGCTLVVTFLVQRVEERRGDTVPDALPPPPGRGFAHHL